MDHPCRRQDRVEADVLCLMCGRLIGELFGFVWRETPGHPTARSIAHLTMYRPASPGAPALRLTGRERFRCGSCGGFGMVGEVSRSVLNERLPLDEQLCPIHDERRQGAGRRPKGCRCYAERAAA